MRIRFIAFLISTFPFARRLLWRWWYNRLARQVPAGDWTFMNYGLAWPDGEEEVSLLPSDEPDRLCVQLYHRVAAAGDLRDKDVLEVGAGRGGGASYVARYLEPAQLSAVDISQEAIDLCSQLHEIPNLKFQLGDAEKLRFEDASFDAVLNVESSHCYGSMETFVNEVARVLRLGGLFLWADLRDANEMPGLEELFAAHSAFEVVEQEDIAANIDDALRADDARKRARIIELCPPRWRELFEQFAGLTGSVIQRSLHNGSICYKRFVLRRVKSPQERRFLSVSLVEAMDWNRTGTDKWR